ncbi:hypothetical protein [Neisseria sicca]
MVADQSTEAGIRLILDNAAHLDILPRLKAWKDVKLCFNRIHRVTHTSSKFKGKNRV